MCVCVCVSRHLTQSSITLEILWLEITFKLHYYKCIQRNDSCSETRTRETDTWRQSRWLVDLDWERQRRTELFLPRAGWLELYHQQHQSWQIWNSGLTELVGFTRQLAQIIYSAYCFPGVAWQTHSLPLTKERRGHITNSQNVSADFFFFVSILKAYGKDKLLARPDSITSCLYI